MDKFGRNYQLLIEKTDGQTLKVVPPFTVEFDIHRNSLSSANVAQIRIYNLSPNNRNQIRKDQFDTVDLRQLGFSAGYGSNLALAFLGNITQAWSIREGTNMITQIESFDGGYAYVNSITSAQFPGGTSVDSIIDSLARNMASGLSVGAIGSYPGKIQRGNTYNGSTADILREMTGGGFFIDNGKIHCLNDNECIEGGVLVVNAASGLLGTPLLENQFINFDMLFEPGLRVGSLIRLESETADRFNGTHKVISIHHRGIISEATCGSATTSVGLLPGTFLPVAERS